MERSRNDARVFIFLEQGDFNISTIVDEQMRGFCDKGDTPTISWFLARSSWACLLRAGQLTRFFALSGGDQKCGYYFSLPLLAFVVI